MVPCRQWRFEPPGYCDYALGSQVRRQEARFHAVDRDRRIVIRVALHCIAQQSVAYIRASGPVKFRYRSGCSVVFRHVRGHRRPWEWVTARRATGLIFASAMFAIKFGAALGGWVIGLLLAFFGYVANGVQTGNALRGIGVSISIVPGVLLALATLVLTTYELDERTMLRVEADLTKQRKPQSAPVTG